MATHRVTLQPGDHAVEVPTGALVSEAISAAELEVAQPCGGQGRCGRCAVLVEQGNVRRRSTIRLSADDLSSGWALACQSVIESDVTIQIPEQERIERRLVTEHTARGIELPFEYLPEQMQPLQAFQITLEPPTIDDSKDDLTRLRKALEALGHTDVEVPLPLLRSLGDTLRAADWAPHLLLETAPSNAGTARLLDLATDAIEPIGLALDIGHHNNDSFPRGLTQRKGSRLGGRI